MMGKHIELCGSFMKRSGHGGPREYIDHVLLPWILEITGNPPAQAEEPEESKLAEELEEMYLVISQQEKLIEEQNRAIHILQGENENLRKGNQITKHIAFQDGD